MAVGDNKFSRELQTSKRFRLTEQRVPVPNIGGWNPDAPDASRPVTDLAEMKNMRKMRLNEIETRSGYKQWRFPALFAPASVATPPVARAEYRLNDVFVDVTLYTANGNLYALLVYPAQEGVATPTSGQTPSEADVANGGGAGHHFASATAAICPAGSNPIVAAKQFGTYLIVSVLARDLSDPDDCGMYALSPAAGDTTLQQAWTITQLGKQVSPCPSQVKFATKIQGDLLAIPAQPYDSNAPVFNPQIDPVSGLPVTVPLKINADYFLISQTSNYPVEPLWEIGKRDTPVPQATRSIFHTQNRGWKYRIVVKKKFVDARNQEHYESDAPSADFYVPAMEYGPAGIGVVVSGVLSTLDQVVTDINGTYLNKQNNGHGSYWRDQAPAPVTGLVDVGQTPGFVVGNRLGTGDAQGVAFPTNTDYFNLRNKFRALYPLISDGDALFFAAAELGWIGNSAIPTDYSLSSGAAPYLLNATSYQVNSAPNTIFNWNDFGITDTDAYAIDIYRTTYTLPDESKDLAAGLPYQPYNYGLVGTLYKTDGTFTDNVADANLLTAYSPLDAEGFLVGEFAGEVLQVYQGSLVLGNTRTKLRLRTPWSAAQSFVFGVGALTGYASTAFALTPGATFPSPWYDTGSNSVKVDGTGPHYTTEWFYAYQNQDGILSDLAPLPYWVYPAPYPVQVGGGMFVLPPGGSNSNVLFTLPRGYSTLVTQAVIFRAVNTGASISLYREATVSLSDGYYVSDSSTAGTLVGLMDLDGSGSVNPIVINANGSIKASSIPGVTALQVSDDPGTVFWSALGDAWNWPQANNENETDQDPITGMESEIGPLYVFSDKSIVMTRLNGYQEPVNTYGSGAGCISRFGLVKVNADLYALSGSGLIRVDGSGSFPFPAFVQSEIWARLQERIKGQSSLSGVRNKASMTYLSKRNEVWITFPSTGDLGGSLPSRTFVIKQMNVTLPDNPYRDEMTQRFTYEFDIACAQPGLPAGNPPLPYIDSDRVTDFYTRSSPNPTGVVFHLPHADGSMWSAWWDPGEPNNPNPNLRRLPALVVQDNDRPEFPWPGQASFQWQNSIGEPAVVKRLDGFRFVGEAYCDLYFIRGMLRTDGIIDPVNNTLRPECEARQVAIQGDSLAPSVDPLLPMIPGFRCNTSEYELPIAHNNSIESAGTPPALRLVTRPNADKQHLLRVSALTIWYNLAHYHKP